MGQIRHTSLLSIRHNAKVFCRHSCGFPFKRSNFCRLYIVPLLLKTILLINKNTERVVVVLIRGDSIGRNLVPVISPAVTYDLVWFTANVESYSGV